MKIKNRWLTIAGVLQTVYGLIELVDSTTLILLSLHLVNNPYPENGFIFKDFYNLIDSRPIAMLPLFLFYATLRITSGIGILKNRLWGFWMAIFITVSAVSVMPFLYPLSSGDAIAAVLIISFLLVGYFQDRPIIAN